MKKKILFIVPLPPPVHGSTVMCKYIKESELINSHYDCDYVNLSTSRKIEEVQKFGLSKIWRFFYSYLQTFGKLIIHRYDLCYVALAFHKGLIKDVPFVILCKLFKRKIVIHLHGKGASQDAKNRLYRFLMKVAFKNTKVIMLSSLLYPDVSEFVEQKDVLLCPNGIPFKKHNLSLEENEKPRLLFLSNLIVSKGVYVLLDALQILKEEGYSFVCDFVGGETKDISETRFKEEVERRGLNGVALYCGRKYGDEKDECLDKADVLVFPTFYENETFGLVNLEAMAHHLPIVSTNEGGIPDVVKDGVNGLIAESRNPVSLANCIRKLLDNKGLRIQMGINGYNLLIEKYTIECFEHNVLNALSACLNKES